VNGAIDLADGLADLVIALLLESEQRVLFIPSLAVDRMSDAYCRRRHDRR
jgi:hypothetical protein